MKLVVTKLLTITYLPLLLASILTAADTADLSNPTIEEPTEALSLPDALGLTLGLSPHLEPYSWDIRIQEALAIQSSVRPNPELSLEVENVFGSGVYSNRDLAETTLSVGQVIELGRKREKRMELANQSVELANKSYLIKRAEVLHSLAIAFFQALTAQEYLALADANLLLEQRLASAQAERLKVGKISELEVENGKTALALAKIDAEAAKRDLRQARLILASHWGNPEPRFERLLGSMAIDEQPPEAQAYREKLVENPVLNYATHLIEQQRASLALENAFSRPDLTAGVGIRRIEESNDSTMVFQLSLPLPLFNNNRGNIQKAQAELSRARASHRSKQVELETAFAATYERLSAAHQETTDILNSVLPSAQLSFQFAQESYQLGKFSYFELKTAQSILIESRKKLLNAQLRYHKAKADLELLAGKTF